MYYSLNLATHQLIVRNCLCSVRWRKTMETFIIPAGPLFSCYVWASSLLKKRHWLDARWRPKQQPPNIVYPWHERKQNRGIWVRHKWFGGENRELFGQRTGWRRVQYSEKPFPVFVLTSSLISVMQKNWSEEREDKKAQVRNQSILGETESQQHKKKRENIWILSASSVIWCRLQICICKPWWNSLDLNTREWNNLVLKRV